MSVFKLDDLTPISQGDAWIAPTAAVIGRIDICKGASIWFHAVVRGDNELIRIGERSNVQDGAVLHTDMGYPLSIGDDCTIGHQAVLHGCMIGDNTLVGIGAVIMNGARIGNNCIIGARALITEKTVIPNGSVVIGTPGKVVRTITDEESAANTASAEHYVANWKRYVRELK
jgi:carbonic anhydrase/acetyltransferase-like protein (isoleucine patch superfamily)